MPRSRCGRNGRVHHAHLVHGLVPVARQDGRQGLRHGAPLAHQAQAIEPVPRLRERLVATAPTPASTHGTHAPTPNQRVWTATPRSPFASSRATIDAPVRHPAWRSRACDRPEPGIPETMRVAAVGSVAGIGQAWPMAPDRPEIRSSAGRDAPIWSILRTGSMGFAFWRDGLSGTSVRTQTTEPAESASVHDPGGAVMEGGDDGGRRISPWRAPRVPQVSRARGR